jgi:putative ABC transport system permease protein
VRIAKRIHAEPGDVVRVEWAKSSRRGRVDTVLRVGGLADEALGSSAYADYREVLRSFAGHAYPYASFGAQVDCDREIADAVKHRLERSDGVGVVMTTDQVRKQVDEQMGAMFAFIVILLAFGEVLAGSAIHTVASISLIERTRELATLRSLGFSARDTSRLVSLELYALAVLGLAVGIPVGAAVNTAFLNSFATDNMAFRTELPPWVHVTTAALVLALVSYSSWAGMRRLRRMDLSEATKARE